MNRRKSSLNFQHQLQFSTTGSGDEGGSCGLTSAGRFSPHPNEIFLHQPGKLSIPPIERFDDASTCCLPPPSPAPNNDRYIMGMVTPPQEIIGSAASTQSTQFYPSVPQTSHTLSASNSTSSLSTNSGSNQTCSAVSVEMAATNINIMLQNKYATSSMQQHVLSPNSHFRLQRYRESQQKAKHIENPISSASSNSSTRFFLSPSTQLPIAPSETYTYLSSAVHTPVKRYVPTPPPTNDTYADLLQTASTAISASSAANSGCGSNAQYVNTLPYNYRMKCCNGDNAVIAEPLQNLSKSTQPQCSMGPTTASSGGGVATLVGSPVTCSPMGICKIRQIVTTSLPLSQQQAASVDFVNTTTTGGSCASGVRVNTPINTTEVESLKVVATPSTCLHCNTARRTTGVHQTTQTTGPISPVPVPVQQPFVSSNVNSNVICGPPNPTQEHNASITQTPSKSTTESHISPLSPNMHMQQHPLQPKPDDNNGMFQQHLYTAQPHKTSNVIVSASSTRLQPQQHQQGHANPPLHLQVGQQQTMSTSQQQQRRYSRKKRISQYLRKKIARFFGVEPSTETKDFALWLGRHRRMAQRRFGTFNTEADTVNINSVNRNAHDTHANTSQQQQQYQFQQHSDRPDILPAQSTERSSHVHGRRSYMSFVEFTNGDNYIERKASVANLLLSCIVYIVNALNQRQTMRHRQRQWSRSFAPMHVNSVDPDMGIGPGSEICEGAHMLIEEEMFFDSSGEASTMNGTASYLVSDNDNVQRQTFNRATGVSSGSGSVGVYISERHHGWRTTALSSVKSSESATNQQDMRTNATQQANANQLGGVSQSQSAVLRPTCVGTRGNRIVSQLLDGVLENSRRPLSKRKKFFTVNDLDDRTDHRPFFTYWINTVQIIVLFLSILCYGIAPIGYGSEQKTGQVLVTSLSLQTVQHLEQRNLWIGPRNNDLVHMGAKFAACMRRDVKIMEVLLKTRRLERETACCIRNDDSGCVQSSQADCSVRGLFPTKSISTWKKWSPGESGPGGRISGSVCGLDPKFCDAPASIAPYEWPDDITKWPICRKTNSFSQRFRYKDHTAEHMVCEVIGHPCCTGVYGECRITTREYCDFVNGYFHEEASLCSQISCLNNVCGMFPFLSVEVPDQFYRVLTSLCMHAGILHLLVTVVMQHIFLADLERLIGPIRTAVVYIGSGLAGNLTSAVLVPYKSEVGPSAALGGVVASLVALLIKMHWKQLHKPQIALLKLTLLCAMLFGIGTLPYQLNFAGLLAGVLCGIFLTVALVPFVSFSKYKRQSKINLIWTCIIFHVFLYATMTAVFYIFPMEFTNLHFGDTVPNNYNSIISTNPILSNDIMSSSSGRTASSSQMFTQMNKPQFYYHHHSDDIIRNSAALTEESKIARLIHSEHQNKKKNQGNNQNNEPTKYRKGNQFQHYQHNDDAYKAKLAFDAKPVANQGAFNIESHTIVNQSKNTKNEHESFKSLPATGALQTMYNNSFNNNCSINEAASIRKFNHFSVANSRQQMTFPNSPLRCKAHPLT